MKVTVKYGVPGHEREYIVLIEGFGIKNYIPDSISDDLARDFPFATVMNRGSRVEVMTDDDCLDMAIEATVLRTIIDRPWIKDMAKGGE